MHSISSLLLALMKCSKSSKCVHPFINSEAKLFMDESICLLVVVWSIYSYSSLNSRVTFKAKMKVGCS